MSTHPAPVPAGTPVVVQLVDGDARRWIDSSSPDDRLLDGQPVVHLHGHGLARIGSTLFSPHVVGGDEPLEPCTANLPRETGRAHG